VYLFDGVDSERFDIAAVKSYLDHWLPWLEIELRPDLLAQCVCRTPADGEAMSLASRLCADRVRNPAQPVSSRQPLKPELDYECRLLAGRSQAAPEVIYDGNELQRLAFSCLQEKDHWYNTVHIWFTERCIASWEPDDRRYHARVSVYGCPSIISTSGMVIAPAREREYYIARRLGISRSGSSGTALQFRDPVVTEIAKGYAMQAVFYALTGDPFCDNPACRLYNAHWQKEMMDAQLSGPDYCAQHENMLAAWQGKDTCMRSELQS